ncbi:MAG: hypothetical protein JW742_07640 [Candidatus Aminicenantes bacterium]|nr:hypothetical protein [Candidatus Aminicenantes bacterium]
MDELKSLGALPRVKAPPGFEARVLAGLAERTALMSRRRRVLRLSLAGASAFVLVGFVVTRLFILPGAGPERSASLFDAAGAAGRMIIPINETVDYFGEVRAASRNGETIYILEQVSDVISADNTY